MSSRIARKRNPLAIEDSTADRVLARKACEGNNFRQNIPTRDFFRLDIRYIPIEPEIGMKCIQRCPRAVKVGYPGG